VWPADLLPWTPFFLPRWWLAVARQAGTGHAARVALALVWFVA
jgi:hypothetical protein